VPRAEENLEKGISHEQVDKNQPNRHLPIAYPPFRPIF